MVVLSTPCSELVVLAGLKNAGADLPSGGREAFSEFARAADLVCSVREFRGYPDRRGIGIGVTGFPEGHPATPHRLREMNHLEAKVDAGADDIRFHTLNQPAPPREIFRNLELPQGSESIA